MSILNLNKIVEERNKQFGILDKKTNDSQEIVTLIEALFKFIDDSNKTILKKIEEIDKKVTGE